MAARRTQLSAAAGRVFGIDGTDWEAQEVTESSKPGGPCERSPRIEQAATRWISATRPSGHGPLAIVGGGEAWYTGSVRTCQDRYLRPNRHSGLSLRLCTWIGAHVVYAGHEGQQERPRQQSGRGRGHEVVVQDRRKGEATRDAVRMETPPGREEKCQGQSLRPCSRDSGCLEDPRGASWGPDRSAGFRGKRAPENRRLSNVLRELRLVKQVARAAGAAKIGPSP
jgi:hypothetical protein